MSRKSGNRFSDKDMRSIKKTRAHPDSIAMRSLRFARASIASSRNEKGPPGGGPAITPARSGAGMPEAVAPEIGSGGGIPGLKSLRAVGGRVCDWRAVAGLRGSVNRRRRLVPVGLRIVGGRPVTVVMGRRERTADLRAGDESCGRAARI